MENKVKKFSWEGIKNSLGNIISLWPQIWAIPVSIGILIGTYYVIGAIDWAIGSLDIGILQGIFFMAVLLVAVFAIAYMGIKFNQRDLWKYYKDEEWLSPTKDLEQLKPWQRLTLLYSWLAFLSVLGVVIFLHLI